MKRKTKHVGVAPLGDPLPKRNTQYGITLVALIITIIVLLILAVVTIAAVTGDHIINHAENARDQYRIGMETENGILKYYEDYLATGAGKASGNTEDPNSIVAKFKAGELHVGDYVNYTPTTVTTAYDPDNGTAGSKTGYSTAQTISQENLNWRVLGYDASKNQILLISGAPTTASLRLSGHAGYNNGEDVLKDTCAALYSNSTIGATARSITMEDIDTYLGGSAYDKTTYRGGSSGEGGYGYQHEFTNINTPTAWKGRSGNTNLGEWSGTLTSTNYWYTASDVITDTTKQNLVTGKNVFSDGYYYWVASRACDVYSSNAYWGVANVNEGTVYASDNNICISNGDEGTNENCLRPVVSLSSKVTAQQVPKLESAPTESWSDPLEWY